MEEMDVLLEPDPVIEVYKKNVDKTLLMENLKLSTSERLDKFMAAYRMVMELKAAGERQREKESQAEA